MAQGLGLRDAGFGNPEGLKGLQPETLNALIA